MRIGNIIRISQISTPTGLQSTTTRIKYTRISIRSDLTCTTFNSKRVTPSRAILRVTSTQQAASVTKEEDVEPGVAVVRVEAVMETTTTIMVGTTGIRTTTRIRTSHRKIHSKSETRYSPIICQMVRC